MKTPLLLACLAVATTAIAVELKSPDVVAGEWSRITEKASPPPLPQNPIGLAATSSPSLPPQPPVPTPVLKRRLNGDMLEMPPGQNPDKGFRVANPDGDKLPPGARAWVYQGKMYWLIPIASSDGK